MLIRTNFKKPLFTYSKGFYFILSIIIVISSGIVRFPFFYKYAHVSQSLFSLLFLNFTSFFYLLCIKSNKLKISIPQFVLLSVACTVVLSRQNNATVLAVLGLYLMCVILLSSTILWRHTPLFLSYAAICSAVYSLGLNYGAKLGVYDFPAGRISGNYGQANLLATLMLLGLFSYSHLLSITGRKRFIYFLPSLLLSVVLFMTASRAGLVALCCSSLLVIGLWRNEKMTQLRPYFVRLFVVIVIALCISHFVGEYTPLSRVESAWSGSAVGTYRRLLYWLAAILLGCDHWLTGVGFGGYARNLGDYAVRSAELLHLPSDMIGETLWAHNDFLHIFAEHGAFVFLMVLFFVALLFVGFLKQLTRTTIFIFLGIVSLICMMCFSHPLYYHNLALMACFALAPVLGRWKGRKIHVSRKFVDPIIILFIIIINFLVISHYFKMFELYQFKRYVVTSDAPFTERYKMASSLYLKRNMDDSIYGWQFKHSLYVELASGLERTDNLELARYVLPDMISYSKQNRFPSYLFSLATLQYALGDYANAKFYASQAYDRNPSVDRYFDLLHLCNVLLISRDNDIVIEKLISPEKLEQLKDQKVIRSRQLDSMGIAL